MTSTHQHRVTHKTASYTVNRTSDKIGTIFTNRGATGAITFTLPKPVKELLGCSYEFLGIADQAITVASAAAGDIITKNDVAANSLAASTAGALIGARMVATCVDSAAGVYKWHVVGVAVGITYTVAT